MVIVFLVENESNISDAEKAQLLDDYGAFLDENPNEPVESVIGSTPKGASIV